MSQPSVTIAFFGVGRMGQPMASNLASSGHTVRCFDPAPPAADAARSSGLEVADSAASAVDGADVLITMLPSGQHVLDVYRPETGILSLLPEGALVIDSSTIDVADARSAHELSAEAGLLSVDSPVSGGVVGAEAGTLTFMVGGTTDAFHRAEPILAAMGKRVVHCGDPGAGQAVKVCNNLVLASSMIAVSEAFVLAESLGLDHQALFDVLSTSTARCWALDVNCPVPGPVPSSPANREFDGGFASSLMAKDLRLAASAAGQSDVDIALGRHALAIYEELAESRPNLDFSVVIEAIRQQSGIGSASHG